MNFAEQLRKQALDKQQETSDQDVQDAVAFIKERAQGRASQGCFELRIDISILPFQRNIIEKSLPYLRNLGLTCELKDETVWFTNTDGDTDTYLIVNW